LYRVEGIQYSLVGEVVEVGIWEEGIEEERDCILRMWVWVEVWE
jgi:hypothetical protein